MTSLLADAPFEGRDPRLVLPESVGCGHVVVKAADLVSPDPDSDQIARDAVALGLSVSAARGPVQYRETFIYCLPSYLL